MYRTVQFDEQHHEFTEVTSSEANNNIGHDVDKPLSIIVQVTRRCNLKCDFCSESEQLPDPSFEQLVQLREKLAGIPRIYLSGGEPLLRQDIFDLLRAYKEDFPIVGLPSNCIGITQDVCEKLKGTVSYINAGLDGPRAINDRIRGGYDDILAGLHNLRSSGIGVSLSTVILRVTIPHLPLVVQTGDSLGVAKIKMVIPIARGRARDLTESDYATKEETLAAFNQLRMLKTELGWKPRLKFTFWDKTTQGYALIVDPLQQVWAWPIPGSDNGVELVGNLERDTMLDIWNKFPYKKNHINKYIGKTMHCA